MLPVLFGVIVFAFLVLGSLMFLACVALPLTRRYALSVALWCAVWGPCSIGWMGLAGLGLIARAFVTKVGDVQSIHAPRLLQAFGWGYLIFGIVATVCTATAAAWLHQVLSHRLTFALFRLYASAVSAGIGSVFGLCLGWWMISQEITRYGVLLWGLSTTALISGFGTAAYKGAHALRGEAPTNFTWISPEEFAGTVEP